MGYRQNRVLFRLYFHSRLRDTGSTIIVSYSQMEYIVNKCQSQLSRYRLIQLKILKFYSILKRVPLDNIICVWLKHISSNNSLKELIAGYKAEDN